MSVWVPCIWVRFVWQCLQFWGLWVIVWLGCLSIFSPCPLCFGCAPGFLSVFWRVGLGFFQMSIEGGLELFVLFIFKRVSSSVIFCVIVCIWFCRVRIMSINLSLLSFSKSDLCITFTQSITAMAICKQCAH